MKYLLRLFSIKMVNKEKTAISQARIWEWSECGGKTENWLLLAKRFGTFFLIGLLCNLQPVDVTRQAILYPTITGRNFNTLFKQLF